MHLGVFFFGNVDMPDAGQRGPDPLDRRYYQSDYVKQYDDLLVYAQAAEQAPSPSSMAANVNLERDFSVRLLAAKASRRRPQPSGVGRRPFAVRG